MPLKCEQQDKKFVKLLFQENNMNGNKTYAIFINDKKMLYQTYYYYIEHWKQNYTAW